MLKRKTSSLNQPTLRQKAITTLASLLELPTFTFYTPTLNLLLVRLYSFEIFNIVIEFADSLIIPSFAIIRNLGKISQSTKYSETFIKQFSLLVAQKWFNPTPSSPQKRTVDTASPPCVEIADRYSPVCSSYPRGDFFPP